MRSSEAFSLRDATLVDAIRSAFAEPEVPELAAVLKAVADGMKHGRENLEAAAAAASFLFAASRAPRPYPSEPDLFLCHSSKDKEFVARLAADLEKLHVRPWLDQWEIGPGDSLIAKIGSGINDAKHFGAVISEHSVKSKWCEMELREAISLSLTRQSTVIPLRRDRTAPPAFLRDKLYVDFSDEYYRGLMQLAAAMHGLSAKQVAMRLAAGPSPRSVEDVEKFLRHPPRSRWATATPEEARLIREAHRLRRATDYRRRRGLGDPNPA
jgi:TIR domain